MGTEASMNLTGNLNLYRPNPSSFIDPAPRLPRTPNEWFGQRYPDQFQKFGSPFLELNQRVDQFTDLTLPLTLNVDFFAGLLGGEKSLGHHVIYFEQELQWYFKDSDSIFKPTSPEKLANLYRALLMKCCQEMPPNTHKLNLFHEFRSDRIAKAVINRAKSVLAAGPEFFSATSTNQRIRGPELHERLILNLVETMLAKSEGACLTVTQAYQIFCRLSERRGLGVLKRSIFKELMRDCVRDRFDLALRHDVPDSENKHQQAWKGLKLIGGENGVA